MTRQRIERIEKSLRPGRPFALLYVRADGSCYDVQGREYRTVQQAKDYHPGCHHITFDHAARTI